MTTNNDNPTIPTTPTIHIIGDSHAQFNFKYLPDDAYLKDYPYKNWSVPSKSIYLLTQEDITYENYGIKDRDIVVYQIGEIDCRSHIYKQTHVKNRNLNEIVETLTNNFFQYIEKNKKSFPHLKIIICCVPPPMDEEYYISKNGMHQNEFPFPFLGINNERIEYTCLLNRVLEAKCKIHDFYFLNYYSLYVQSDGTLKTELSDDVVHILESIPIVNMLKDIVIKIIEQRNSYFAIKNNFTNLFL